MPTPPKGSISPRPKQHQIEAFEFAKTEYDYLVNQESFINGEEFAELEESEQISIQEEMQYRNDAYEKLRQRVENY